MSRTVAKSSAAQEIPAEEGQELPLLASLEEPLQSPVALLANWTPSTSKASTNRREVFAVVLFSALLHAGVAAAAYQSRDAKPTPRPLSRVEIEVSRPVVPPKPLVTPPTPPPPPKIEKQEVKQLAPRTPQPAPVERPADPAPAAAETPVDTGSSAPSDAEGELYAGSGGLGTAAPAPPPPPPPAPVAAPPPPEPIIQAREGANYLKNPRPAYPGRAKREGWEGTTVLRVQVLPSGKPGSIKVQKSSGRDILDDAASEAVKKWTFSPATQGGKPVTGWVTVPIVFRLQ